MMTESTSETENQTSSTAQASLPSAWDVLLDTTRQASAKVGSRLVSTGGGFVTHIFLARLGTDTLAAGAPITVINRQFTSFVVGILVNAAIQMNRQLKSPTPDVVGQRYQQSLLLSLMISLPIGALLWYTRPILIGLGQPPAIAAIVQQYFRALVIGFPTTLWLFTAQQMAVGLKKPWAVFLSGVFQSIGLVGVTYGLLFGAGLGAAGLGYASGLVSLVNFLGLSAYFRYLGVAKQYRLYDPRIQSFRDLCLGTWNQIKTGFVVGLQVTSELLVLSVIIVLAGLNGTLSLASAQVALQYLIMMIIPLSNGAQVSGIFVGQQQEAGASLLAQRYGNMGIVLGGLLAAVASLILFVGAPDLAKAFLDENTKHPQAIQHTATQLLYLLAATQIFDTMRYFCISALRGLQDLTVAMVTSVSCIVGLTLASGALFDFGFGWGVEGLFLGRALGVGVGSAVMGWRWHQQSRALTLTSETAAVNSYGLFGCCQRDSHRPTDVEAEPILPAQKGGLQLA